MKKGNIVIVVVLSIIASTSCKTHKETIETVKKVELTDSFATRHFNNLNEISQIKNIEVEEWNIEQIKMPDSGAYKLKVRKFRVAENSRQTHQTAEADTVAVRKERQVEATLDKKEKRETVTRCDGLTAIGIILTIITIIFFTIKLRKL